MNSISNRYLLRLQSCVEPQVFVNQSLSQKVARVFKKVILFIKRLWNALPLVGYCEWFNNKKAAEVVKNYTFGTSAESDETIKLIAKKLNLTIDMKGIKPNTDNQKNRKNGVSNDVNTDNQIYRKNDASNDIDTNNHDKAMANFKGAYTRNGDILVQESIVLPTIVDNKHKVESLCPEVKQGKITDSINDRSGVTNDRQKASLKYTSGNTSIYIYNPFKNNLTAAGVDVIVNAANHNSLTGGGGVDGMITSGAGNSVALARSDIQSYCDKNKVNTYSCHPGGLFVTGPGSFGVKGNKLYSYNGGTDKRYTTPGGVKAIVHTPGPNGSTIPDKKEQRYYLSQCYYNTLKVVHKMGLKSVAFPAISTGIFSADDPYGSMLYGIRKFLEEEGDSAVSEIRIYCNPDTVKAAWSKDKLSNTLSLLN